MPDACLRVADPGLLATVQDEGRPGVGSLGIAIGGAADLTSHRAVNRVLGNPSDAATIELTLTGGTFAFPCDVWFALGGAPADAWLERADTARAEVAWWTVTLARAGEVLRIGHTRAGVRTYLGVAGGVRTPVMMGSRSTHVSAEFPIPALRAGTSLPLDAKAVCTAHAGACLSESQRSSIEQAVFRSTLRVTVGPHAETLGQDGVEQLFRTEFRISSECNRAGVRLHSTLHGAEGQSHAAHGRMLTQPMAPGFVQVPARGRPIILGREHPTTGGYPVVASVIAADMDGVGQLRPGRTVRFEKVTMEEAQRAWRERPLALGIV